jgi:KAP family P-loop domain
MKEFYDFLKSSAKYSVLPLCLFFLFKNGIDKVLTKYLVEPIFSTCYPASITYDIALGLITLAIAILFFAKLFKGAKISSNMLFVSITYLIIYLVYRLNDSPFLFTSTSFSNSIKISDFVCFLPLALILGYIAIKLIELVKSITRKDALVQSNLGFTVDEAIKINQESDLLNRNKFIDEIASRIKNTETKNAAFAIGVVAKWGSGKSTFINSLLDRFKDKEFVKIELNVWKYSNSTQMIETFFKELRSELKSFSFSINNKLQDYTSNLLKGTKNNQLNTIKNLAELILPDNSLESQYESINEEIKQINKKIIVVIDDLDRLDKKEIYEVIRLIRNTANFANTFFVVAYDRNYILNAIEEINPYQVHYFLEKIFQIEFSLPSIPDNVLQNEIGVRLKPFLTDIGWLSYENMIERDFEYEKLDLTTSYIHNIRDVIRFVNSFRLNYEFVKDEIYFPEFYNLQLIEFKHPDLYLAIYKEQQNFFTIERDNDDVIPYHGNSYSLIKIKDAENMPNLSALKKYIQNEKLILKLSDKDIDTISASFSKLFPYSPYGFTPRKNSSDHHLSVIRPSMFDRYFVLGIEGKLSNVEFSKMRNMPYNEFSEKLKILALSGTLTYEIAKRFEIIRDFDSKEEFKKIVKGIFYFANLPSSTKKGLYHRSYIGYDNEELTKLIGDKTSSLYFENNEEYRKFILDLLVSAGEPYRFTDEFLRSLLRRNYNYISHLFSNTELSNLALENFKTVISIRKAFTYDLWMHFQNCEFREEETGSRNEILIRYLPNIEALHLLRKFICKNDIDAFLLFSIKESVSVSGFYVLGFHLRFVFKSDELFIWLLKRYKGNSIYSEEYLKFYDALRNDPKYMEKGVPLSFFKIIPVSEGILE